MPLNPQKVKLFAEGLRAAKELFPFWGHSLRIEQLGPSFPSRSLRIDRERRWSEGFVSVTSRSWRATPEAFIDCKSCVEMANEASGNRPVGHLDLHLGKRGGYAKAFVNLDSIYLEKPTASGFRALSSWVLWTNWNRLHSQCALWPAWHLAYVSKECRKTFFASRVWN